MKLTKKEWLLIIEALEVTIETYIKIGGYEGLNYREKVYLNNAIKKSIANRLNTKGE
ncbi:MAG: hypothetical protein PHS54_06320 [Clostridia bacterium]|nr:hypothetical protein [Clostridia bacterium]